jgi:hypothetical protein
MVQTRDSPFSLTSDSKDLCIVSGQTMVQKWPLDHSSHTPGDAGSPDFFGGTATRRDPARWERPSLRPQGARVFALPCPREQARTGDVTKRAKTEDRLKTDQKRSPQWAGRRSAFRQGRRRLRGRQDEKEWTCSKCKVSHAGDKADPRRQGKFVLITTH